MRLPAMDRFKKKVGPESGTGCWPWLGVTTHGYGRFYFHRRSWRAHRWLYETTIGPVPTGLDLDHLCRNRSCVNPAHLEAVTRSENCLRGETGHYRRARAE